MYRKTKRNRTWTLTSLVLLGWAGTTLAVAGGPSSEPLGEATRADVIALAIYVVMALGLSFLCSVAEAVLLSLTPSYIAGLEKTRPNLAKLLRRLKQEDVDQSLAAILTLNTIAHTVGAIGSGAKATIVFGSAWFGVFSAVMTLLILFLSEIVPKTLGAIYWKRLAGPTALFVRMLIIALYPLIWVSEKITKLFSHAKEGHVISRDELIAMAGLGAKSGQLAEHESRVIRNLFRLGSLTALDIMTPRTVVLAFPRSATVAEVLATHPRIPFSRLPVYQVDLDHITGFVLKDDLLLAQAENRGETTLESLEREIPTLDENLALTGLLEQLLDNRQHIAVVGGQYGETRGLVTLEDVVETLLGTEIVDELDKVDDMRALARQRWEKRAATKRPE